MTYEAWRISYQSSEQAARAAYAECDELRSKIEAAENDATHQKALADSALRVAEGWERKCGEMHAALRHETDCVEAAKAEIKALRAKIAEMEQQRPAAWCATDETGTVVEALGMNQSRRFDTALYLSHGAQNVPKAVAYLDLGTGGYMDIGTDLTDEALAALPKGRHMLGIVGTYGVDGYVPAQPAPSVPREAIDKMLMQLMDIAVSNGANSISMPDEYVEVAAWLCGIPAQPAPSINEGVRKVTLGFRWESEAQHHIPTIEIEFDPVSPDSPNDARGWQDRDRLAAMLTPEAKP